MSHLLNYYRSLGRLERVLLVLLPLGLGGMLLLPSVGLRALAGLVFYLALAWFGFRLIRYFVRRAIWRLRNRLIVAYSFIAVVPIVLIVALIGMLAYAVLGQVAVYLVTSELDRRAAVLASSIEWVVNIEKTDRHGWIDGAFPVWVQRFPGLEVVVEEETETRYPKNSSMATLPEEWDKASGLLVKDRLLYLWARVTRDDIYVTATMPLTAAYVLASVPDLGEVNFIRREGDGSRIRFHAQLAGGEGQGMNRLPPPINRWDIEIDWGALTPVSVWDKPGRTENQILRVATRPSAVLGLVFAQKVNFAEEAFPQVFLVVFSLFLLAELVSVFVGVSITRTITGAVHDLYEGTERVMEGDFTHRIRVNGKDQLASLSESFNRMTENLERLLRVAKENERLQAELEIAREVQAQLYPRDVPVMKTLELTACCNPARVVSGDYYDYQRLSDNLLAVAMGDVAGKGISAALLMATVQSSLRTQLQTCLDGMQPSCARLVTQLNLVLYTNTAAEKFATFCLGIFNDETSVFRYTNAGHLPPVLIRKGTAQRLEVNGMVVGAFPFAKYDEAEVKLESGDVLLFYTDGITEPENEYGEMFGEERLVDLAIRNAHRPGLELLTVILDAVKKWTGSPELQDDMTLLLVRRR